MKSGLNSSVNMASVVFRYLVASLLLMVSSAGPTVDTSIGRLEGTKTNGTFVFRGIPFAEPPVGDRRFLKPVKKAPMQGVYNATYFRNVCPQNQPFGDNLYVGEEDCLHLNIYTPVMGTSASTGPKAVMVWIHGGSYLFGSGNENTGTLLSQNDVVVVSVNYRLGALGFLNTKDEYSDSNVGLWDVRLALQWVKQNIALFGGDPQKITIFGESAGSAIVTQLAISPRTFDLFHRMIAQSGTTTAEWSHFQEPLQAARKLGKRFGCSTVSNDELIKCLRKVSPEHMVGNQLLIAPLNLFLPVTGTDFLPYSALQIVTGQAESSIAQRLAGLDLMIGQNTDEGSLFLQDTLAPVMEKGDTLDAVNGISDGLYERALVSLMKIVHPNNLDLLHKMIAPVRFMYTEWSHQQNGVERAQSISRIISDVFFTSSIIQFTRFHAMLCDKYQNETDPGNTYSYLFDHRGSWMSQEAWRSGSSHADELFFMFGLVLLDQYNVTQQEKALGSNMMVGWATFAKTGNPNPESASIWPMFDMVSQKHLVIRVDGMSVEEYIYNKRVEFWQQYYPQQAAVFQAEPQPLTC